MKKILFLHGALGAAKNFDALIEKCCSHFECITIDFPGHGNSDSDTEYSIESFTDFLIKYITTNFNEPVSVFGYSMGGYVALNAVTQKPGLFGNIMTLATKFDWNETEGRKQALMLDAEKIEEKIPHYAKYLAQLHAMQNWKDVIKKSAKLIEKISAQPPLQKELLSEIENKICVGLGDQDTMVNLYETNAIYKLCKNGSMYVIPNMQHPIEKINVDLVYAMMHDFFSNKD